MMSEKPSFFAELKRRNVIRMAGLYLVGAWLLIQVASTVLPMFGAPEWLPRSIVILLAVGFLPVVSSPLGTALSGADTSNQE
jgi:adenylate cyclase